METEDELRAENNLLKLKLEMEHGMKMMDTSALDAEMENKWLSDIYNFENSYRESKLVSIYDFIGRPEFKPANELSKTEISEELEKLDKLMQENRICLDCLCEYEDEVIYKFITEEFFLKETDDLRLEGMFHHFIYEEYHPNHDYDLRRVSIDFMENILTREWIPDWYQCDLSPSILFRGKNYDKKAISKFILTFQECFHPISVSELDVEHVEFDFEKGFASVRVKVNYTSQPKSGNAFTYSGVAFINFKKSELDYWSVSNFQIPGFGD
jgi:hypothetical protein